MSANVDVVALIRAAGAAVLNAQAEVAQAAAQDLAPKDTRALVESIKVTKATGQSLVSQVYSDADHALYQHEALDLRHDDGQAKFLEAAVLNGRAAISSAGASAARQVLG